MPLQRLELVSWAITALPSLKRKSEKNARPAEIATSRANATESGANETRIGGENGMVIASGSEMAIVATAPKHDETAIYVAMVTDQTRDVTVTGETPCVAIAILVGSPAGVMAINHGEWVTAMSRSERAMLARMR